MKFVTALWAVIAITSPATAQESAHGEIVDMGLVTEDGRVITDKKKEKAYLAAQEAAPKPPTFIREIIGKSKKDVDAILGRPFGECKNTKYGQKCYYNGNDVEIVYIKKKSDWITVHNPKGIGFYAGALAQIGLECPVTSGLVNVTRYTITWESTCKNILSASLFPGQDNDKPFRPISYIYIKVATP